MRKPKKTPVKLDETELEIIKADIAFLKEQEIKNGNWDKWLASQKQFKNNMFKSNRELYDKAGPKMKQAITFMYGPDPRIQPKPTRRKSKKIQDE